VSRVGFDQDAATDGTFVDSGPVAIGSQLPAVYRDYDPNVQQFTAGLDAVLAPVWLAIDCFDAYLDPAISPEDMVDWLSMWVGVVVDDNWHPDQLRRLVAQAADLYRWRGTPDGIANLVEAYTGLRPTVTDNGGVAVSAEPGGTPPGSAEPVVNVKIAGSALGPDDMQRLYRFLGTSGPVHVPIRLETS
jgi:phage tail-like protein